MTSSRPPAAPHPPGSQLRDDGRGHRRREGIGRQLDPELDLLREGPFLARAAVKGARAGGSARV